MKVQELKRELALLGAKTTGRKKDLIERLEYYDRNNNFQTNDAILPESLPMPDWPSNKQFKTITIRD